MQEQKREIKIKRQKKSAEMKKYETKQAQWTKSCWGCCEAGSDQCPGILWPTQPPKAKRQGCMDPSARV